MCILGVDWRESDRSLSTHSSFVSLCPRPWLCQRGQEIRRDDRKRGAETTSLEARRAPLLTSKGGHVSGVLLTQRRVFRRPVSSFLSRQAVSLCNLA